MNKQALSLAIFIAGAYPAASSALGLGDIESNSHLNQPLRAKIDLLSAAPADASKIQVRLAPPDVFNRVGVARPDFLGNLRFTPTVQGGKPVILVSSDTPIQEPFVNFLLEVSWPQGQLLKEYTVMLDPPVLMQPGNTVAGEAAVRAEPKAAGNVRRPVRPAQPAAAPAAPPQPAARNRTYRVKSGDTLFGVASRLQRQGINNDQMMMALFRANPEAFIDENINNLRTGALMKTPSSSQVGAVSRAEARREIRQQNAEWREFRKSLAGKTVPQSTGTKTVAASKPQSQNAPTASNQQDKARLEVLGAKTGDSAASNAAVAAGNAKLAAIEKQLALASESLAARQNENNELKSRVTDLESMLSKKNRLLALRDTQLAELQQQLSDNGIKVAPSADTADTQDAQQTTQSTPTGSQVVSVPPEQGKDIQTHMANVAGQDNNTILRTEPPVPSAPPVQQIAPPATPVPVPAPVPAPAVPLKPVIVPVTPAEKPVQKPSPVFADQTGDNNDLLGLLTSPLALKIGAGSLALLLLLWLLGRRRKPDGTTKTPRREANLDDDLDMPVTRDEFDVNSLEQELEKADKRSGGTYGTARNTLSEDPFGIAGNDTDEDEGMDVPPIAGQPHPAAGIEDDCLTEANVYIAYGLYQQAESELKKCIERHPDKPEYRHKLLECYFVANNREAFDNHAQQFAVMDGAGKDNLWKSVAEWGRKISPDNALYQGSAVPTAPAPAPASSVAATVATALGGMAAATAGASLAADNKVSEPTPVPRDDYPADDFSDLDLGEMDFDDIDLDKLLQDSDEMADFGEPPVEDKSAVSSEIAPELPTLPELDVAETKPAPLAAAADDEPFDFNLDELDDLDDDLDLDFTLDTDDKAPQPAQESIAVKPREPEPDNMYEAESSDHLLDFDLDELDDLDDLVGNDDAIPATPANHVAATAAAVAVPVVAAAAANSTNLNLHLDNQTGINRILPKDTFYAPISDEDKDWLGDIDDALSFLDFPDEEIDLHEAHISTKLDLARAYLDMGDIEGARSTLEEVMVEGNDDQRREAEVLLHQTG